MKNWKDMKIDGIASIERIVAEYEINELYKTPCGFRVKIYESSNGDFSGYTNLALKDVNGEFHISVGFGKNESEALLNTIEDFMASLSEKEIWDEQDFKYGDFYDF